MNISIAKVRLFVGNIPKQRTREDIMSEFSKMSGEEKDFAKLTKSFLYQYSYHVDLFILQFCSFQKTVINDKLHADKIVG